MGEAPKVLEARNPFLRFIGGVSALTEHPGTVNDDIRLLFQTWIGAISLCKPPLMFRSMDTIFIPRISMQCHTNVEKVPLTLRLAPLEIKILLFSLFSLSEAGAAGFAAACAISLKKYTPLPACGKRLAIALTTV